MSPMRAVVAGVLLVFTLACGCMDDSAKKIETQRKSIDQLTSDLATRNQEIGRLQQQVGTFQESERAWKSRLDSLNASLADSKAEYQALLQQSAEVSRFLNERGAWDQYRRNAENRIVDLERQVESLSKDLVLAQDRLDESNTRVKLLEGHVERFARSRPRDVIRVSSEDPSFQMGTQRLATTSVLKYSVNWLGKGTQVGDFRRTMVSRMLEVRIPLEILDPRGSFDLKLGSTQFLMTKINVFADAGVVSIEFAGADDFERLLSSNTSSVFLFSYGPEDFRSSLEFAVPRRARTPDEDMSFPVSAIALSGGARTEWASSEGRWISIPQD